MKWLNKLGAFSIKVHIVFVEYYTAIKKECHEPRRTNTEKDGTERQVASHRTCVLKPTYFKNMHLSLCKSTHVAWCA